VTGGALIFRQIMALKTDLYARLVCVSNLRALRYCQMTGVAYDFGIPLKVTLVGEFRAVSYWRKVDGILNVTMAKLTALCPLVATHAILFLWKGII
jgi:hypothetical protein